MVLIESNWEKALGVRPSVSAVILKERKLLLQLRSDGGQWGLPGGSVEVGESVTEAMVREVTGVTVLSLPHDISTVTGEEVVLFTLAESPLLRATRKK